MNKGFETYFKDVDYLFHLNDVYTNMINDLSNKDNLSNEEIENQLLASNEFSLKVIIASCIEHYSNEILYPQWINTPEFKGFKKKIKIPIKIKNIYISIFQSQLYRQE